MMDVNVLDVTLNLRTGLFRHFIKKLNALRYVSTESNYPPKAYSDNLYRDDCMQTPPIQIFSMMKP